jgi:tetratricopeptide (TPR) repeat protein
MSERQMTWGRFFVAAGLISSLLVCLGEGLEGQELLLKREIPGADSVACPETAPTGPPTQEEMGQASQLGSEANQENILGNQVRARDLLERATELDPTSALLAFRYGIILENLGEVEPAIEQFCRADALGAREQAVGDPRPHLEELWRTRELDLPEEARSYFLNGLLQADLGDFIGAEEAFAAAFLAAPEWGDAVYNRGVMRIRLGEPDLAVEDLQRYLAIVPEAEDAILVSQRIGQLQIRPGSAVSPGTALGLGILIPGMGQFYTGRVLRGFGVLAVAGGAIAVGFLIEEVEVKCVGRPPSGGDCPSDRVISESTNNPYMIHGLAAAGVVALVGAVEAYFKAKRPLSLSEPGEVVGVDVGSARVSGLSISASGPRLNLNLLRVTF